VRMTKSYGTWPRRTIERAISILRLIRITQAAKDVELRSPARECPECHGPVDLVVLPGGMCGSCWSREIIAAWQVPSSNFAMVEGNRRNGHHRR
jgi:hypothetical protein